MLINRILKWIIPFLLILAGCRENRICRKIDGTWLVTKYKIINEFDFTTYDSVTGQLDLQRYHPTKGDSGIFEFHYQKPVSFPDSTFSLKGKYKVKGKEKHIVLADENSTPFLSPVDFKISLLNSTDLIIETKQDKISHFFVLRKKK